MDPKVNGQMQREWGWLVAIYLFLGGVGAGAYTIAAINSFFGEGLELSTTVGLWIGFPALVIGSLCLLLDLGSPGRFLLAGLRPGTSWMARGFWIILLFMGLAFLHLVFTQYIDLGRIAGPILTIIAILGIVTAILTMGYTGILLSASKGIPFWRSGVVPVVFVVSAMVTGHFSIMLGLLLLGRGPETLISLQIMEGEAIALVVLEVLAIFFFLHAAYKLPDARESAQRILRRRSFVIGYIVLGLATPLALMLVLALGMDRAGLDAHRGLAAVGAVLGLLGGLLLRQAVLVCGALPTLNIAGFQFRRIARARDPRPGVGLLPPQ